MVALPRVPLRSISSASGVGAHDPRQALCRLPRFSARTTASAHRRRGGWRKLQGINRAAAREIRTATADKSIPVLCTGAFQTLAGIRDAIASGDCDAVTMVRPLLANPTLPRAIVAAELAGADDYVADEPCSLCNRCLLAAPEFPVGCLDDRRLERAYPQPAERYDEMMRRLFALYR